MDKKDYINLSKNELIEELLQSVKKNNSLNESFDKLIESKDNENKLLEKLILISEDFIKFPYHTPDYQKILDTIIEISGAKFGAFNINNDTAVDYKTVALGGDSYISDKASLLLGFDLINKVWTYDYARMEMLKNKTITRYESLHDLTHNILPKESVYLLEKSLHIQEVFVIKIAREAKPIGDFTLLFYKGDTIKNESIIEVYVHLVGMYLDKTKIIKSLEISELKSNSMITNISDVIAILSPEGDLKYISPNVSKWFDWEQKEVLGENCYQYIHPSDIKRVKEGISKLLLKEGNTKSIEFTFKCKNGKYCPIELTASNFCNNSAINGILLNYRDITDRKQAEMTRDQQLYYTTALNEIAEVVISGENSSEILANANRIIGETLKLDRALIYDVSLKNSSIECLCEWIGSKSSKIPPLKDECMPINLFRSAINITWQSKVHLISHSNSFNKILNPDALFFLHNTLSIKSLMWFPFAFYDNGFYLFTINQVLNHRQWSDAEIGFMVSVAKQVNIALMKIKLVVERKEAEVKIRKIGLHYKAIIENAPDGVVLIDRDGEFVFISSSAKKIFGYSSNEEIHGNPNEYTHPDDINLVITTLQRLIDDPSFMATLQYRFLSKSGTWIWIESTMTNLLSDENVNAIVINFRDISERKHAEEEIMLAKEKAEQSDLLKSAFLTNISHEIRTPMNGILGFTSLLKEPKLTGEEQRQYIELVQKSGDRMINIISDIISISKIESGSVDLYKEDTSVNELLHKIYDLYKEDAEGRGIVLSVSSPLSNEESVIFTDKEKLYSILVNLIKNSLKFTKKGSIEFGYVKEGVCFEFFVKDSGIGIVDSNKEIVFERFRQGSESLSRNYEGAGLGLSISKAYVEILGGKIWVESEIGKGSIFYFTIPFMDNINNSPVRNTSDNSKDSQIRDLKILIVEDDEKCEILLYAVVKMFGKEVYIARTGCEAIEICQQHQDIDLILMDFKLPEMDGYEATRQIRLFNQSVVIIGQTAYALIGDKEKAIAAGCNDYISKPFHKALLLELIKKHFSK